MRTCSVVAALCVVALAAARTDHDFEFEDAPPARAPDPQAARGASAAVPASSRARRPRRYVYDPHNALCDTLVCGARELCVLRDARTALCVRRRDLLRGGDVIVSGTEAEWERAEPEPEEDDVFYEAGGEEGDAAQGAGARCVGCPPAGTGAHFLCGSDNRTYSSLCRLDLHNCVRRGARPVRPVCRGFCPCTVRRRPARRRPTPREPCALDNMANRLLDWFSVLMEEAAAKPPPAHGFPSACKPEVRWMFAHLDSDGDALLSPAELYALRHDERERCLRPFLESCGAGGGTAGGGPAGGGAGGVSRAGWCGCLRRAARPCRALWRARPRGGGAWVPRCDARGYYRARQCHAALGVCWCVDAHGVELAGSRSKGARACPGEKAEVGVEGDGGAGRETGVGAEGAPDDDEDGAGSGDNALR